MSNDTDYAELISDEIEEIKSAIEDVQADMFCLEECYDLKDMRENLSALCLNLKTAFDRARDAIAALKEKTSV